MLLNAHSSLNYAPVTLTQKNKLAETTLLDVLFTFLILGFVHWCMMHLVWKRALSDVALYYLP